MSLFQPCSTEMCAKIAEYRCSCNFLSCQHHLHEHMLENASDHKSHSIVLSLERKDINNLQHLQLFQSTILEIIRKRNKSIEILNEKIKKVEREAQESLEFAFKQLEIVKTYLRSIIVHEKIPKKSKDTVISSFLKLKEQGDFNLQTLQENMNNEMKRMLQKSIISRREIKKADEERDLNKLKESCSIKKIDKIKHSFNRPSSIALSSCNCYMVIGYDGGVMDTYILAERNDLIQSAKAHKSEVSALGFCSRSQRVVSGGSDGLVKVWQLFATEAFRVYNKHEGIVTTCLFIANDKIVASSGTYNSIHLWKVDEGSTLFTLNEHTGCVNQLLFDREERQIISASSDSTVKIWDFDTKVELNTFTGHSGPVTAIARHSHVLASGGTDKLILLWNLETGERIGSLNVQFSAINSIDFSDSGDYILSGHAKGTSFFYRDEFIGLIGDKYGGSVAKFRGDDIVSIHLKGVIFWGCS